MFGDCLKVLSRKKKLSKEILSGTNLHKCLSTFDLAALGIGCTLSAGIYVLIGEVIRKFTGPAIVLSFLFAALASALAALSYAEFGARVPKAGSAYIYCYVTVGELCAFVVGWNVILEYVIGAASTAKSISFYLDSLTNHAISGFLLQYFPLYNTTISPYVDFVSFFLIIILAIIVCFGVNSSTLINNIFVIFNLFVLVLVFGGGCAWIDIKNWSIPKEEVPNPEQNGVGGFTPFGQMAIISGASICFYSYIGFDVITIAGEESVLASKSVPVAIAICLGVCTLLYVLISIVLTLMVPYYQLSAQAPISSAFKLVGWVIPAHLVNAAAIICLVSCLLSYMIAMPRVFYAMASDGLLFKPFSKVNATFKTPVVATVISGLFTALIAMFLNLIDLVSMMSIGTLLAYSVVSFSVLWLRYQETEMQTGGEGLEIEETERIVANENKDHWWKCKLRNILCTQNNLPSKSTEKIFLVSAFLLVLMTIMSSLMSKHMGEQIGSHQWWALLLFLIPNLIILSSIFLIFLLPKHQPKLTFTVPLVPFLPIFSLMINLYLMVHLNWLTWIRFFIWMALGFIIYFSYSIQYSQENTKKKDKAEYEDIEGDKKDKVDK